MLKKTNEDSFVNDAFCARTKLTQVESEQGDLVMELTPDHNLNKQTPRNQTNNKTSEQKRKNSNGGHQLTKETNELIMDHLLASDIGRDIAIINFFIRQKCPM